MTLDQPVIVQAMTQTGGSGAAAVQTWADTSPTIWAAIDYPGGRKFRGFSQLLGDIDAIFTIRDNSTLTVKHRLKNGGLTYDITHIQPPNRTGYQDVRGKALRP